MKAITPAKIEIRTHSDPIEVGAENWALLASIVATCKLNDVDPVAYIAETFTAILDGHLQSRIEELMPWRANSQP